MSEKYFGPINIQGNLVQSIESVAVLSEQDLSQVTTSTRATVSVRGKEESIKSLIDNAYGCVDINGQQGKASFIRPSVPSIEVDCIKVYLRGLEQPVIIGISDNSSLVELAGQLEISQRRGLTRDLCVVSIVNP